MTNSSIQVVVLDDEPDFCRYVSTVASGLGFSTRAFSAPDDLIAERFDAVDALILDLYMPAIDGVELLRFIASLELSMAVVLMSGGDVLAWSRGCVG